MYEYIESVMEKRREEKEKDVESLGMSGSK
jgi:hypothetical protein